MARDIQKEQAKIRNGNRFVEESEDGRGVFSRDVDRLFLEYTNLRKKIYTTQKYKFPDEATRRELESYIDEQFVKLVKEYDINSPVDFPGYIKTKLNLRVKQVFVKGRYRDQDREQLTSNDWDIENMLADEQLQAYHKERHNEMLSYLIADTNLTDVQKGILNVWLSHPLSQTKVTTEIVNQFGLSRKEASKEINELKEYLGYRLKDFLRKKEKEEEND